eukprot:CAMPEP_0198303450 /NCGR_PEP_ID=MMETSP1449-20131203/56893_1 /TAXON_ID=420275 /ORGANISM="Attheya septentrionalis, Strain CCMP2084" /LENGTH=886 /DNA_ID=CAMNT_0044005943 /DNA_START=29 /DNA_END=2689 /DNA_ORIENTATION=-
MAGTERRKRVLIPIATGSDEFEMACLRTILWEFGAEVVLARVVVPSSLASSTNSSDFVEMHQGTKVQWDMTIEEAATYDWDVIVLPGGIGGAEVFRYSPSLHALLLSHCRQRRLCGSIGFSPVVLACLRQLEPAGHAHYPSPEARGQQVPNNNHAVGQKNKDEVVQGIFVTATGPESAQTFALQLGSKLYGNDVAQEVADTVMPNRYFRLDTSEPSPPTEPVVVQRSSTHTRKPRKKQIIAEHREEVEILDGAPYGSQEKGDISEQEKLADKPSTSVEQDHVTEHGIMTDASSTIVNIEEDNINDHEIMTDAPSTTVNIEEDDIPEVEKIMDVPSTTVNIEEDNINDHEIMTDVPSTAVDIKEDNVNDHGIVTDAPSTTVNIEEDNITEVEKIIDVPSTTVDIEEDNITEQEKSIDVPSTTVNIEEVNITEVEIMKDAPSTTANIEKDNRNEHEIVTDAPSTTVNIEEDNRNEHEIVTDAPSTTVNIEEDNGIEQEKIANGPSKMIDVQSESVNIEEDDTTKLEKIAEVRLTSVNFEADHVTEKDIMIDGTSEPMSSEQDIVTGKKNRIDRVIPLSTSPTHYDDEGLNRATQPSITSETMIQRKTDQVSSDVQTSEMTQIIRIDEEKSNSDASLNTLPSPISSCEETKRSCIQSSMTESKNEPLIVSLHRSVGSACEQVENTQEATVTMKTPFVNTWSRPKSNRVSNKRERNQKKRFNRSSGKVCEDVETIAPPPKKTKKVKHEKKKEAPSNLVRNPYFKFLLWAKLETIGWKKVILAQRPNYMPPGVDWTHPEMKCRIDYFDSYLQIIRFLKKRKEDRAGKILEQWEALMTLSDEKWKELKRLEKLPKAQVVEFVVGEVIAERSEFVDWKYQQEVMAATQLPRNA